jgi:hypothetical protein
MSNLRDWQKKASERRDVDALAEISKAQYVSNGDTLFQAMFKKGFNSRDAEIDLLLQIIEKQSEALCKVGEVDVPSSADKLSWIVMLESVGVLARTTQAEVETLIEKLVKSEQR